jgi:membrane-associated phospholipid phosphatase
VGFNSKDVHQSFPSGDVVKAFSLSTVLAAEAKSLPISLALYSLAAATAFQRLHRDRHWFSDTVSAAALGTAVGLAVVHAHRSSANSGTAATVAPTANGVAATVNF